MVQNQLQKAVLSAASDTVRQQFFDQKLLVLAVELGDQLPDGFSFRIQQAHLFG
ncbi:hypothetical protein D3C73_1675270 [compost metagenome]